MPSFLNLTDNKLNYKDTYIYLALRSFNNSERNQCYPAYETIAELAGVSKKYVMQSLARLSAANEVWISKSSKKHTVNRYSFKPFQLFVEVPYEIFDNAELTFNEKSMLICIRQLFGTEVHFIEKNITSFAKKLGLTYKTIYAQYQSLLTKGYVIEQYSKTTAITLIRLKKIDWSIDGWKPFVSAIPEPMTLQLSVV